MELFEQELNLQVSPETDLLESGLVDSAIVMEVLLLAESRFGVRIPDDGIGVEDVRSINSMARCIRQHAESA